MLEECRAPADFEADVSDCDLHHCGLGHQPAVGFVVVVAAVVPDVGFVLEDVHLQEKHRIKS